MKLPNIFKIFKIFKKTKECKHDEYCPVYLSYLDKYGEDSKHVKHCKNSDKQYCTKYRLVDQSAWKEMSKKEKLEAIRDMKLIEFIDINGKN